MTFSAKRILLVYGLLFSISCKSTSSSSINSQDITEANPKSDTESKIDLNDISVLLPMFAVKGLEERLPYLYDRPNPKVFAPDLPAAEEDLQGFVYPDFAKQVVNAFDVPREAMFGGGVNNIVIEKDFSNFRLVAVRFDPCPNDIQTAGDDAKCVRVLRLVWQRLDSSGFIEDSNLHTIYRLTDGELKDSLQTLETLHAQASLDTSGLPLQAHPVILKEGANSPYFNGILGLVHRYAHASKLVGVAALFTANPANNWQMLQGAVRDGQLIKIAIPTLEPADGVFIQQMTMGSARDKDLRDSQVTTTPFALPSFPRGNATKEEQKERLDKSFAIDNPELHNAFNLDCASCHRAFGSLNYRNTLAAEGSLEIPEKAFRAHGKWNMNNVSDARISNTSLQMFSYTTSGQAKVTQRVINESASVLNYLEKIGYLKANNSQSNPPPLVIENPAIESGKSFRIVSRSTGKCLEPTSGSTANGALITSVDCSDARSQMFRIDPVKAAFSGVSQKNIYTVAGVDSNQCLDIKDGSKESGVVIQQWTCNGNKQQTFTVVPTPSGLSIRSNFSSRCLETAKAPDGATENVQQVACSTEMSQIWDVKEVK